MQDAYSAAPVRKSGSGKKLFLGALLAFAAGAGGVGWLAWQGGYDFGLGLTPETPAVSAATTPAQGLPAMTATAQAVLPQLATGGLEARIGQLEDRLTRLDMQAQAASGNAARAEGLLVALAARRAVERGAPLGYLEGQLKLRFSDAQPRAVVAIIEAAAKPVTLDQLAADLDALAPALADRPADESGWQKFQRELTGLFIIKKEETRSSRPQDRIDRAKLLLRMGRADEAADEIARLPGAAAATKWSEAARRYSAVQQALDLLETSALLEPRELKDNAGDRVEQPSPLAVPAPVPTPTPTQTPESGWGI